MGPQWKVFIFGGNSGDLDQSRPQGKYLNDLQVLEHTKAENGVDYNLNAVGSNIVITPFGGTKEYFLNFAHYTNPYSIQSIQNSIRWGVNQEIKNIKETKATS